jgi:hypothetical protein
MRALLWSVILDSPKLISALESDVAVTYSKMEDYAARTMEMMATPFFMAGTMHMSFDLKFYSSCLPMLMMLVSSTSVC